MRAHLVIDSRLKSDNKFCGPPAAPQMLSHLIEQGLESILRVHHFKASKSLQPLLAIVSYETDEEQF